MPQLFLKTKRSALHLRAARRHRRDLAVELPLEHPLRRGGAGADGRQRRRAQAGVADAADRRADRATCSSAPGCPRAWCGLSTARGNGPALVEPRRGEDLLHRSVEAGRGVGEDCARRLKGSVLELGGKDPMIVLSDANLQHAVAGALWGGFANAGQTCSGIERVYVMREVADRFIARRRRGRAAAAPRRPAELGHRDRADGLRASSSRPCASWLTMPSPPGATLHCGGPAGRAGARGDFYAPAVLTGITTRCGSCARRSSGPVLPIVIVDSEDEAVALANDSRVRPRRLGVDARPRQGRADRARNRVRDGVDQRPHVQPRRLPVLVGRREGIGPGPHALEVRPL